MGRERGVLAAREELGGEAQRALASQPHRLRLGLGRQHVQLRRARRRAEGRREASALAIEVEPVENAVRELALSDEHAIDREGTGGLVEGAGVGPRAAVDVVGEHEAIALQMGERLELAGALVFQARDRHRLDLAGPREVEVAERARVVEQRRRQQDPARRRVAAPEARERIVGGRVALLDRGPVEHGAFAVRIDLVQHDVAHRVAVGEDHPRVVGRPRGDEGAVRALPELLALARRELHANRRDGGLDPRLDGEVRDLGVVVDVDEVRATPGERRLGERLRKASFEGDDVRHVVLVAVRVEQHDDLLESRQDVEEMAADELRVLQGDLRRQERLRNAARGGHREEAEVTRRGWRRTSRRSPVSCGSRNSRAERSDSIRSARRPAVSAMTTTARPRRPRPPAPLPGCRSSRTRPGRPPCPRGPRRGS